MDFKSLKKILILEKLIGFGAIAFLLLKFTNQDNDFRVFYHAGQLTRHGVIPWNPNDNPQQMFLYGPLTALTLIFFTMFKYKYAILILRLLTLSIAFFGANYILKSQKFALRISLSLLFLLLFPIRANLEYGGLGLIYAAFVGFAIFLLAKRKDFHSEVTAGFLFAIAIDFKPQIYLPCLVFLIIMKKTWALLMAIVTLAIGWIIFWLNYQNSMALYIHSLHGRSKLLSSSVEQMDLRAILIQLNLAPRWADLIVFVLYIILIILAWHFRKDKFHLFLIFLISFLLLPFFHSTDLTLIFVLLLITVRLKEQVFDPSLKMTLLALTLASAWSNSLSGALLATISILLVVALPKQNRSSQFLGYGMSLIPILFQIVVRHFPSIENVTRHILNYISCWVAVLAISKSTNFSKFFRSFIMDSQPQSLQ
jgi:hypothetical protein